MSATKHRASAVGAAVVASVVAVAAAFLLVACGSPRSGLGTRASACFRALPAAREAVHDKGTLVGVRIMEPDHAERIVPPAGTPESGRVCVIAFRGPYAANSVSGVVRRDGDRFALVAVRLNAHPTAIAAVLTDKLPTRFRHL